MKKFRYVVLLAIFMLVVPMALAACNTTLSDRPNAGINPSTEDISHSDVAYFEQDDPQDVKISFEADGIQKVSYKYRTLASNEYKFGGNVLTVNRSVFDGETAGDKRIRVFVNNSYVEITVRVVTKVIMTPDDFNGIREHLNGVYVLGADIDFGNRAFWPIGKAVNAEESTRAFEGIFDGMGHSVSNIVLDCYEYNGPNDEYSSGPSTGSHVSNGANYNVGIFASTGGSAQILNTAFYNVTVNCQGLGGAVAGSNGGLIKNCRVSCTLYSRGFYEKAAGVAGVNGSGDAAGKIENCIVTYTYGEGTPRGIADWNVGTIKNCFAAAADNFVYYPDYDYETGKRDPDFNYNTYLNAENWISWVRTNYSLPAFPGTIDSATQTYYPGGQIINSDVVTKNFLLDPANFPESDGWDYNLWDFHYGAFPALKIQH